MSQCLDLTLILLNYKRPANVKCIVEEVAHQGANVWVWDNSGNDSLYVPKAQHVIFSKTNRGCAIRWAFGASALTEFIGVIDDDLIPKEGALRTLVNVAKKGNVAGISGRKLQKDRPYGRCRIVNNGRVDILLGRLQVMHRSQFLLASPNPETFEDDIYASSRFTVPKVTTPNLIRELNPGVKSNAVCSRLDHYYQREVARRNYFTI